MLTLIHSASTLPDKLQNFTSIIKLFKGLLREKEGNRLIESYGNNIQEFGRDFYFACLTV